MNVHVVLRKLAGQPAASLKVVISSKVSCRFLEHPAPVD
jgi:hypothetical protein